MSTNPRSTPSVRRFDRVLVATTIALALVTFLSVFAPVAQLRVIAPALDLTMDTVALVISSMIAVLLYVRYRERHEDFALFESSAFVILAMANCLAVVNTLMYSADSTLPIVEPSDDVLYVFSAARLFAGGLLVVGGVRSLRGYVTGRPELVIGVPAALLGAVIAFVAAGAPMPPLVITVDPLSAPLMSPLGSVVQVAIAALLGGAALLARAMWMRDGAVGDKYISLGLVVAAFSQLTAAVYPGTHPGPVSPPDILRLGFYVILLLAIEAEARSVMSSLRKANETLEQLRISEVERAAIEERARLARELHDGLAQALWLAKLKVVRLLSLPTLDGEERVLANETADAVELGLNEARQAVLALHMSASTDSAFVELLERYVNDYADRLAIPVEFSAESEVPALRARTQAELLRIAQEALANVHRHADATSVSVRVGVVGDQVAISIDDDGRGFNAEEVTGDSFGLAAMRERASLIGGGVTIVSSPGQGTHVAVRAPLSWAAGSA